MAELPDFKALHKKAFRAAYDYLEKNWPPQWDDQWWKERAKELGPMSHKAEEGNGNPLEAELYLALYCYFEKALKKWWPEEDVMPFEDAINS